MTEDAPASSRRGGAKRSAPAYCDDACRCALWDLLDSEDDGPDAPPPPPKEYHKNPAVLSYTETCALFGGVQAGSRRLLDSAERMRTRRETAITAYGEAEAALDGYEAFIDEGRHAHVVARARKAEDARAERPDRGPALWLRIFRWPAVLIIGAFDVWFFQQYFLNVGYSGESEDPGWFDTAVAYVPGVSVVFMVLLAATMIADLARRMRRRRTGARMAGVVSAMILLGYVGLVLTIIGYFAYLRAHQSFEPQLGERVPPMSHVMLIGALISLLTLTSILMKVKGDDPHSDTILLAGWRRRRSEAACRKVQGRVRKAFTGLASAHSDLRAVRDQGLADYRDSILEAYRRGILEPRGQHRPGTEVPPPVSLPPSIQQTREQTFSSEGNGHHPGNPGYPGQVDGAAAREYAQLLDSSLVDGAGPLLPEFESIRQPRPSLGPLPEVCRVVAETEPKPLRGRWDELNKRLNAEITRLTQPHVGTPEEPYAARSVGSPEGGGS